MPRFLAAAAVLAAGLGSAQTTKTESPLDKISAGDVPAALRPTGKADGTLAIFGDREAKFDCAAFSPNGKYLAYGGPGETIHVVEFPDFKTVATFKNKETVRLAFSPSGRTLAATDSKGNARTWKVSAGTFTDGATFAAHKNGPAWGLAFAPGGQTLVTGGSDGVIKVWDLKATPPKATHTLTGHKDKVWGLAVNWDGTIVASAGWTDGTVRLWDIASEKGSQTDLVEFKGKELVTGVAFDPDGKKLAVAVTDGKLRVFGTAGGKLKEEKFFPVAKNKITGLSYSGAGDLLAMIGLDPLGDRVLVYGTDGRKKFDAAQDGHVEGLAFAADGRHLAVVYERSVHLVRFAVPPPPKK